MDRAWSRVLVLVSCHGLVSCHKADEAGFVADYVDLYCARSVECFDPAIAVFDGPPSVEDCKAEFGPTVAASATSCKLEEEAADLCLSDLDGLACPDDGTPLDEAMPASCDLVWKRCKGPVPTDEPVDGTQPAAE